MQNLKNYINSALNESAEFMIINESVQNFFENDKAMKRKYAQQVWDILQKAYESQGGIAGSGFSSPEDMVNKIPFWKLDIVDDQVLAVALYKFKDSEDKTDLRKIIAGGTLYDKDRGPDIRKRFYNIMKMEFDRSIMEVSGLMESYLVRYLPELYNKYRIPYEKAVKILPGDELIQVDKYRYKRLIGGNYHEKIMLGTAKSKY